MVIKVGHRGAAGYEPENTLRSFKKAIELNVDLIELDIRICKSGEIVVIHDDSVNRTSNGKGKVKDLTLKDLKKFDFGKGEKIPTIEEVLDLINKKTKVEIEIKEDKMAYRISEIIKKYLKKGWRNSDFIISSFIKCELIDFKKYNPRIKTSLIAHWYWPFISKRVKEIGASKVELEHHFIINKKLIESFHRKGIEVYIYSVDDKKDIEKLKAFGTDGIYSNYPDRIS